MLNGVRAALREGHRHIDSVPGGGNFDGELGSLAAIEILRTLNEHQIVTRHPLEVTIWSNEQGGTIGSSGTVGAVSAETRERQFNGIRMIDGLRATGTEITLKQVEHLAPAVATPEIQRQIELACKTLGLKSMHLPSGAGHDAQVLAGLGPMGMIFVPSVGGISHSPKEFSRWAGCANGANVLLQAILQIDQARAELA